MFSVFQWPMILSLSVEPVLATASAISRIASTPEAIHHSEVSARGILPRTLSTNSWFAFGSLPSGP